MESYGYIMRIYSYILYNICIYSEKPLINKTIFGLSGNGLLSTMTGRDGSKRFTSCGGHLIICRQ